MNNIVIRTDGNKTIGLGHIIRCLALACQFRKTGVRVFFLLSDDKQQRIVHNYGFDVINVHSDAENIDLNAIETLQVIRRLIPMLCVIDSYYYSDKYLVNIKHLARTAVIVEDDPCRYEGKADIVINYNIYMRYKNSQYSFKAFLGPRYALLRAEFTRERRKKTKTNRLLVITGGSDPMGIGLDICEMLLSEYQLQRYSVYLLTSKLNPFLKVVQQMESACDRLHLCIEPDDMSSLMDSVDYAISSGGSTLYELCSRGIPTISFSFVDNQKRTVQEFEKQRIIPYAGDFRYNKSLVLNNIVNCLINWNQNPDAVSDVSKKMVEICDAKGVERIVNELWKAFLD